MTRSAFGLSFLMILCATTSGADPSRVSVRLPDEIDNTWVMSHYGEFVGVLQDPAAQAAPEVHALRILWQKYSDDETLWPNYVRFLADAVENHPSTLLREFEEAPQAFDEFVARLEDLRALEVCGNADEWFGGWERTLAQVRAHQQSPEFEGDPRLENVAHALTQLTKESHRADDFGER